METRVLHIFSGIDEDKYFKGNDVSLLSKEDKDRIINDGKGQLWTISGYEYALKNTNDISKDDWIIDYD